MDVILISDKYQWNEFIQRHAINDGGFLQSWEWGEFQKEYGRNVMRAAVMDKNEIAYGWQMIEMTLPLGMKYWYVPRPVKFPISNFQFPIFFEKVIEFAKKEKAIFIRVDGGGDDLGKFGFKSVDISIQPKEEFIIDITKPAEQLLADMKPKTRYNIRVAEKHGVIIKAPSPPTPLPIGERVAVGQVRGIDEFYNLIQKTSERQGIRSHPREYYKKMFEVLCKDGMAKLYAVEYNGKIVAANLMTYFGKMATYLHGGSDDEYKFVMAPYLLQWRSILDAKKEGCQYYNFGGVSLEKKSWEGITRFKTGFSPTTEFTEYGEVWDFPVKGFLYSIYKLLKNF